MAKNMRNIPYYGANFLMLNFFQGKLVAGSAAGGSPDSAARRRNAANGAECEQYRALQRYTAGG